MFRKLDDGMAEWPGKRLQISLQRFDSACRLQDRGWDDETYGGHGRMDEAPDCESGHEGSIPSAHPKPYLVVPS